MKLYFRVNLLKWTIQATSDNKLSTGALHFSGSWVVLDPRVSAAES